jgi:2-polyprenyl-3-methyl-5-hydroxy-6-metoxy-1,4-benzoquinol methylase
MTPASQPQVREELGSMASHQIADTATTVCIACSSVDKYVVFREFDIPVLRCRSCGHVNSSYINDQHYDQYFAHQITDDEVFWWDQAHREMYLTFGNKFLRNKAGNLLDIGAGLGYFVRFALQYPGWNATGYEISTPAVEYARNVLGLKERMFAGAVEDSGFSPDYFDLITLWDVIEHIQNPDILLQYVFSILKPGGSLFLATPNAPIQIAKATVKARVVGMREGTQFLDAKDHVNLYTPESLRLVLHRVGFERVTYMHIRPIQSVSGSRNPLLKTVKNAWYMAAKVVGAMSRETINLNNSLFAMATKRG